MSLRILIGFWSADRGIAEMAQHDLESLGLQCAAVSEKSVPVEGLGHALAGGIDDSVVLLLVCTPTSVGRPWMHELATSWSNPEKVACLVCAGLHREDLPEPLSRFHVYRPDELERLRPPAGTDQPPHTAARAPAREDRTSRRGGLFRGGRREKTRTRSIEPIEESRPDSAVGATPGSAAGEPALRDTGKTQVEFKSYCPKEIRPSLWYTLLAYAHAPEAAPAVAADKTARLEGAEDSVREARADTTLWLQRGTTVTVIPNMTGCTFNPASTTFQWVEDWHRVELRFRATPDVEGFELDAPARGSLAFCVGPVIVGELRLSTYITEEAEADPQAAPSVEEAGKPYRAIFCSYSHKDTAIIDKLEAVYEALGDTMLRDKRKLRSGEEWEPALAEMIKAADVFQLYWSAAAKASPNVEKEWRQALDLARRNFIRPLTWEQPEPELPNDLSHLHFATIRIEL